MKEDRGDGDGHAGRDHKNVSSARPLHGVTGHFNPEVLTALEVVRRRVTADLRAMRLDRETIEDVWQETVLRVSTHGSVRDPMGFSRTVARRIALNTIRHDRRIVVSELPERPSLRSAEEEAADQRAVMAALAAMRQLGEADRQALQDAMRGVAPAVDRREQLRIGQRLSRARRRLLQRMEGAIAGWLMRWRIEWEGPVVAAAAPAMLAVGVVLLPAPSPSMVLTAAYPVDAASGSSLDAGVGPTVAVLGYNVVQNEPVARSQVPPTVEPIRTEVELEVPVSASGGGGHNSVTPLIEVGERKGLGAEAGTLKREPGEGHRLCQAGVPLLEPGCLDLPELR